jgi:hypothetical protein
VAVIDYRNIPDEARTKLLDLFNEALVELDGGDGMVCPFKGDGLPCPHRKVAATGPQVAALKMRMDVTERVIVIEQSMGSASLAERLEATTLELERARDRLAELEEECMDMRAQLVAQVSG